MSRFDPERGYDEAGQFSDAGRERYQNHWNGTGSARGRKRRQVVPAFSSDGERE
jgi:hypothetical protein